MDVTDLAVPVRWTITITAVVCAVTALRALSGRTADARADAAPFIRRASVWAVVAGGAAFALSHTPLLHLGAAVLPLGAVVGIGLAGASLFYGPARRAFDRLEDSDVRALSSYRAIFGAFLFAGAALGLFPPIFALLAGTGDLVAGWLAAAAPRSLAAGGSRAARWVVHGWGVLDLLDVFALIVLVVRPWLVETGSPGPSLLLPWLAVPVLFALNIHGLRRTIEEVRGAPPERRALSAGSEPPRGVRGALGRA